MLIASISQLVIGVAYYTKLVGIDLPNAREEAMVYAANMPQAL